MPGHANIETLFVTLQRIVTKQLGSDLFVHFKCVKVVSQTIAYKYGAFPSQPVSQRMEKQNFRLIPSAQSLLTSQFLSLWHGAKQSWEIRFIPGSPCALKPQLNFLFKYFSARLISGIGSSSSLCLMSCLPKGIFSFLKIKVFLRSFFSATFPSLLLPPSRV